MNINSCKYKFCKQVSDNHKLHISKLLLIILVLQLIGSSFVLATTKHNGKEKIPKTSDGKVDEKIVTNTLPITTVQLPGDTVVVRRGPNFNGTTITGSVRVLLGESINLNSNAKITGDLLVPGTPNINLNGNNTYNGTIVGSGNTQPSGYTVNLNSNVVLRHVVTRTDAIAISPVSSPPQPTGTRDVSLNKNDQPGDFSTIRNLTINSNYGNLVVPQGTYGNLIANSNSGYTFGVAGESTTYNLQNLTLNSNSLLNILGNVTINVQSNVTLNSQVTAGDVNSPISLALNIANGNLSLNSNSNFYGVVKTPNGQVSLNSNTILKGLIICNQLSANSNSNILSMIPDMTPPQITINQPVTDQVITTATITVNGTFQDDSVVTSVKVNNVNATISGNNFTANNVPLTVGSNTITATATDISGNVGSTQITVMRGDGTNQPPVVNAGTDQTINLPNTANLVGTATDDGKPNPPGQLTYVWSKVSGAGTVTFSTPNSLTTSATFSSAGTYTLKLKASDSQLTGEDTVVVTVNGQQNQPPVVNVGTDQTITLPSIATLVGTVTDDGLPNPPAQTTVSWSKVSGSGIVTFSNPTSLTTTATFSSAGTYVLRLTASDSVLTASDDVQIIVNPQPTQNTAPVVNAGPDLTITLPATATLNGTATDDGLPNPPAQLTVSWTKIGGPGTITFTSPSSAQTQASFSIAGVYTLRLSASDSSLTSSDDVIVTVNSATVNQAPIVSGGQNQTVLIPGIVTLQGSVSDDGLPSNTLTQMWSKVSGGGDVVFSTPTQVTTNVTFSTDGVYVLRLTANDGQLSTSADVTLTVKKEPFLLLYSTVSGFDPEQLTISATPLFLSILNRTGLAPITYQITNTTTQQVVATVTLQEGEEFFVELQTSAGDKLLITVVDHPTWQCQITVVP